MTFGDDIKPIAINNCTNIVVIITSINVMISLACLLVNWVMKKN